MSNIEVDLYEEVKKFTNLATRYIRQTCHNFSQNKLTRSQAGILRYIYENQNDNNKIYQKNIEDFFMIRRSTATEILKKLEQQGYIIRQPSRFDHRLKDLILTKKTIEFLSATDKNLNSIRDIVAKNITNDEKIVLKTIITKMSDNIIKELRNEKNS